MDSRNPNIAPPPGVCHAYDKDDFVVDNNGRLHRVWQLHKSVDFAALLAPLAVFSHDMLESTTLDGKRQDPSRFNAALHRGLCDLIRHYEDLQQSATKEDLKKELSSYGTKSITYGAFLESQLARFNNLKDAKIFPSYAKGIWEAAKVYPSYAQHCSKETADGSHTEATAPDMPQGPASLKLKLYLDKHLRNAQPDYWELLNRKDIHLIALPAKYFPELRGRQCYSVTGFGFEKDTNKPLLVFPLNEEKIHKAVRDLQGGQRYLTPGGLDDQLIPVVLQSTGLYDYMKQSAAAYRASGVPNSLQRAFEELVRERHLPPDASALVDGEESNAATQVADATKVHNLCMLYAVWMIRGKKEQFKKEYPNIPVTEAFFEEISGKVHALAEKKRAEERAALAKEKRAAIPPGNRNPAMPPPVKMLPFVRIPLNDPLNAANPAADPLEGLLVERNVPISPTHFEPGQVSKEVTAFFKGLNSVLDTLNVTPAAFETAFAQAAREEVESTEATVMEGTKDKNLSRLVGAISGHVHPLLSVLDVATLRQQMDDKKDANAYVLGTHAVLALREHSCTLGRNDPDINLHRYASGELSFIALKQRLRIGVDLKDAKGRTTETIQATVTPQALFKHSYRAAAEALAVQKGFSEEQKGVLSNQLKELDRYLERAVSPPAHRDAEPREPKKRRSESFGPQPVEETKIEPYSLKHPAFAIPENKKNARHYQAAQRFLEDTGPLRSLLDTSDPAHAAIAGVLFAQPVLDVVASQNITLKTPTLDAANPAYAQAKALAAAILNEEDGPDVPPLLAALSSEKRVQLRDALRTCPLLLACMTGNVDIAIAAADRAGEWKAEYDGCRTTSEDWRAMAGEETGESSLLAAQEADTALAAAKGVYSGIAAVLLGAEAASILPKAQPKPSSAATSVTPTGEVRAPFEYWNTPPEMPPSPPVTPPEPQPEPPAAVVPAVAAAAVANPEPAAAKPPRASAPKEDDTAAREAARDATFEKIKEAFLQRHAPTGKNARSIGATHQYARCEVEGNTLRIIFSKSPRRGADNSAESVRDLTFDNKSNAPGFFNADTGNLQITPADMRALREKTSGLLLQYNYGGMGEPKEEKNFLSIGGTDDLPLFALDKSKRTFFGLVVDNKRYKLRIEAPYPFTMSEKKRNPGRADVNLDLVRLDDASLQVLPESVRVLFGKNNLTAEDVITLKTCSHPQVKAVGACVESVMRRLEEQHKRNNGRDIKIPLQKSALTEAARDAVGRQPEGSVIQWETGDSVQLGFTEDGEGLELANGHRASHTVALEPSLCSAVPPQSITLSSPTLTFDKARDYGTWRLKVSFSYNPNTSTEMQGGFGEGPGIVNFYTRNVDLGTGNREKALARAQTMLCGDGEGTEGIITLLQKYFNAHENATILTAGPEEIPADEGELPGLKLRKQAPDITKQEVVEKALPAALKDGNLDKKAFQRFVHDYMKRYEDQITVCHVLGTADAQGLIPLTVSVCRGCMPNSGDDALPETLRVDDKPIEAVLHVPEDQQHRIPELTNRLAAHVMQQARCYYSPVEVPFDTSLRTPQAVIDRFADIGTQRYRPVKTGETYKPKPNGYPDLAPHTPAKWLMDAVSAIGKEFGVDTSGVATLGVAAKGGGGGRKGQKKPDHRRTEPRERWTGSTGPTGPTDEGWVLS